MRAGRGSENYETLSYISVDSFWITPLFFILQNKLSTNVLLNIGIIMLRLGFSNRNMQIYLLPFI